ncbi:MAG: hypothetical protein HQK76_18305, partial [Desulfobacterales bacterium]|nr:hypothetical protein [Desulfobacterales bacterium]
MNTSITMEGIRNAISNLNYDNPKSLKYKLINAIASFYDSDNSPNTINSIDSDALIKIIWEIDDPSAIKSKRKNLSSVKSTLNNELLKLFNEDKNPEGITISDSNTFAMSDNARQKILSSFTDAFKGGGNVYNKINQVLSIISEYLTGIGDLSDKNLADQLTSIMKLVKNINGQVEETNFDNLKIVENTEEADKKKDEEIDEAENIDDSIPPKEIIDEAENINDSIPPEQIDDIENVEDIETLDAVE